MSTQFTLPQLLTHTGKCYESIDVRTIAADIDGVTYNVVTSIQFSTSSQTSAEEDIRSTLVGHELEAGPLQFGRACLPVNEWITLAAQLKAGELCVGGVVASLGTGVELESFSSTIASGSCGYINNRTPYPMFQAMRATFSGGPTTELGRALGSIAYKQDVMNQLSRSGFQYFREMARSFVGAAETDPCGPSLVTILAPVPVIADQVEVNQIDHLIRTHVRLHPALSTKLQLKGDILGQSWSGPRKTLIFGKLELKESQQVYADAAFDSISPDDFVEVRVVHGDLGIVHTRSFSVRQALPEPSRIADLQEKIQHDSSVPSFASPSPRSDSRKIFVVHGHDHGTKETVARFLGKIDLEPVILHEQADQGRTVLEKFEAHAKDVGCAVVILTADDFAASKMEPDKQEDRARQNVILELGYFVGKLGRDHTFALVEKGVALPSDIHGLIYIQLDDKESWRMSLVRELKAAGLEVDANKAF